MKTIYWSIMLSILVFNAYPQDLVFSQNGDYTHRTFDLNPSRVFSGGTPAIPSEMCWSRCAEKQSLSPIPHADNPRNALTVRMLQGGKSLIGFDYEYLTTDYLGVQFVSGIVGFRAGMSLHFRPTVRSSFVAVQYYHQGLGDSFVQSAIGPSFGYRSPKWLTVQVGFDYLLEKGPKYESDQEPVIITYALGFYFPW